MKKMTTPELRKIIEDFAKEIERRKTPGPKPEKTVIDFRSERRYGKERKIYEIPIHLLRYRKNNGRICSDVLHYEKNSGVLDEKSEETQKIIRGFLENKDKEKTEELTRSMEHDGQREPAIITCDGFLVNGNRRKMVLEKLIAAFPKYQSDPKFTNMKVVILPGKDESGGPPTLLEIEEIENRYQLQSEAKAEYYAFDRALSMRRKIELGMTLDAQLEDDPIYAGLDSKAFERKVKKFEEEYLKPLECIDRYLTHLKREGLYSTVSTGLGDPEGRWQAFLDYYKFVYQKLKDNKKRLKLGVEEYEVGEIEDVAFKIIRQRELTDLPKVHQIMRDLPKWLRNKDSKKELLKLQKVDLELPREERTDADGNEYDEREIDQIWRSKNATEIIRQIKKAKDYYEHKKERETPLDLLKAALKKLKHDNMDPKNLDIRDIPEAMRLTKKIQKRANQLESAFYRCQKNSKSSLQKSGKR